MTDPKNDDASHGKRPPQGPEADPFVEARMKLLADALSGDIDAEDAREVNWDGVDERTSAFDAIRKTLDASITPDRPTQDVPDAYWDAPQGS